MSPLGIGMFAASGGSQLLPPTIVYTGKFGGINGFGGSSTSLPIGTADPSRMVVVLTYEAVSSGSTNTRQVNGSNALQIAAPSSSSKLCIFAKNIPTGTTTTLSWSTQFNSNIWGVVYSVYGLSAAVISQFKFNTSSATTTSNTIDVPANGGVIGFRYTSSGVNGAYGTTWAGLSLDTTTGGSGNVIDLSGANKTQVAASTGLSISASTNYAGVMTLVSFGNGA